MKKQTCCFTGQMILPIGQQQFILERLKKELTALIESGITRFCTGGEEGFDMMAAQTVLKLKEEYKQIKLILMLPCEDQKRLWVLSDAEICTRLEQAADEVVYTSKCYFPGCRSKRDRHLFNYGAVCICYFEEHMIGTNCIVNYAKKKGLTLKNLAEQV